MSATRVLIVEDEAMIAMELERRLAVLGYTVAGSAAAADDAVRCAGSLAPDIVLMDIHLRGARDGIDAASDICDKFGVPVVFLSAFADEQTLDRARTAGPFGYIFKPYREEDLRLAIEIALIKHRAERDLLAANAALETKVRERTAELSRTVEELKFEIAERTRAETALGESEKLHGTILRTALDGFWIADMRGRLLEVNDAYVRMSGYSEQELLSMAISDLEAVETKTETAAHIRKIMVRGRDRFESRHRRKDGTVFDVEVSAQFLQIEDGRFVTFLRDITDRKQAENALAETNVLLETVFDHTHVLSAYLDPQFNFIRVNWAYAAADNREPSFYPGKSHFELYPNEENEAIFRKVVKTGEPIFVHAKAFTYPEHPERGASYWDWSLVPIKTLDGEVLGLVLSLVNVTDSVRMRVELEQHRQHLEEVVAERTRELQDTVGRLHDEIAERERLAEEIHRSKLFLNNILNSSQDGICVLDLDRKIMLVNNAVSRWVPEAEKIGFRTHTCADLYHNYGRCDDCVAESGAAYGEKRIMALSGVQGRDTTHFEVHCYPLNAEDGGVIGSVEYIRDVTAARELEDRVSQYQEQLRALSYEMTIMLNREQRRIAEELHDSIPQTLAFCRMRLEAIEQRFAEAAPGVDQTARFREVCDLLDTSIAEARSLIFKLAPPVLYELGLEPAIQQLLGRLGKSHAVDFSFKGRGMRAPVQGEGAAILYGMVRELLTNCVKHSGASAVSVDVSRGDGNLIVTVRDDGRGFDRAAAAVNVQSERGFGLFSIRERVRHMDGAFVVESAPGRGTSATISIPLPRLKAGEADIHAKKENP